MAAGLLGGLETLSRPKLSCQEQVGVLCWCVVQHNRRVLLLLLFQERC